MIAGAGKVQFVFAGKAHPLDTGGKELIKSVFAASKKLSGKIKVVFLRNYAMDVGLLVTTGSDIWLNNPVRPLEASGTSGMKAAMNGVPNCSILDGWWPEACRHGENGWSFGGKTEQRDDAADADELYRVLEDEVIPAWQENQ